LFSREDSDPGHPAVGVQKDKLAVASLAEKGATERCALNLSNLQQLPRLDRYERRVLSRRKAATRADNQACGEVHGRKRSAAPQILAERTQFNQAKTRRGAFRPGAIPTDARAGIEFIDKNGGGPGVRLRKWIHKGFLVLTHDDGASHGVASARLDFSNNLA
jgi:hypothetical protein